MKKAAIGILQLAMLNIAAVLSIVNYPTQAEYGYAVVFVIAAGALFFFIPCAMVSAEMASALPRDGGLYLWGKEAFGPGAGFVTVAMQFFNSLPWYGTVLTFIATTLAYIADPALAQNRFFIYAVILTVTWGCTAVNAFGIKVYARAGSLGAAFGTLLPTVLIIGGAALWLLRGNPPAIKFSAAAMLPDLKSTEDWMLLAGMMVSLAGIDMTAIHITDVRNPLRTYPAALLISSVAIIAASSLGALSIAMVIPPSELSVASGAAQAFAAVFERLGAHFLIAPVCLLLAVGAIATVQTWLLGPSKGLLEAAEEGYLPRFWAERNSRGIPVHLLIVQAVIISLISLAVFFMPTIGGAFWVFMALSAQMYMIMYLLMFSAAFVLRLRKPELPRPYRIPGGLLGMGIVCGSGCFAALAAMLAGFIPPPSIRALGLWHSLGYAFLLGLGTLFFAGLVWVLYLKSPKKTAGRELPGRVTEKRR